MAKGERVGEVTHFYNKISVAVLRLTKGLKVGEEIHFLGRNTDFKQEVASMQIEHEAITEAAAGQEVAVRVTQRVRRGDSVFLISEE